MKIYINRNCKKVKGSHLLEIKCAYCKTFIAKYKKIGESNLVKMYAERIVESVFDCENSPSIVCCPNCKERIATRYTTKINNKEAYRLKPSAFNKRKLK